MENVIELVKCPLCGTYNVLPLNRAGRTGVEICAPCLLPVPVSFKVPAREYAVIRRKANQRVPRVGGVGEQAEAGELGERREPHARSPTPGSRWRRWR